MLLRPMSISWHSVGCWMAPLKQLEMFWLVDTWTFVAWRQGNDKHHLTPSPLISLERQWFWTHAQLLRCSFFFSDIKASTNPHCWFCRAVSNQSNKNTIDQSCAFSPSSNCFISSPSCLYIWIPQACWSESYLYRLWLFIIWRFPQVPQ